eukprot:2983337-Lingulodinium_polyedra.AAC.1
MVLPPQLSPQEAMVVYLHEHPIHAGGGGEATASSAPSPIGSSGSSVSIVPGSTTWAAWGENCGDQHQFNDSDFKLC